MALELEQIQPWDGQSGTGAEVRGALNRNFEKLKDLSILAGMPIKDLFTSVDLLPRPGISGNNYLVGENLYVWSESVLDYVDIGSVKGQDGLDGIDGKDSKQVTTVAYDGTRPVLRLLTDGSGVSYPVPTFSKSDGSTTTIITEAATYTNAEALSSKVDKGGSDKTLKQVEDEIVQLAGTLFTLSKNLADKSTIIGGIYGSTPTTVPSDHWISILIEGLTPSAFYTVSGIHAIASSNQRFRFYNDSGVHLSDLNSNAQASQTIQMPASATKVAITIANAVNIGLTPTDNQYANSIQFEKGSDVTPYLPFGFMQLKTEIIGDTFAKSGGSVKTVKDIEDEMVAKTELLDTSKNLAEASKFKGVDYGDKITPESPTANWLTILISVKPLTDYVVSGGGVISPSANRFKFYNANGDRIQSVLGNGTKIQTVNSPANSFYAVISIANEVGIGNNPTNNQYVDTFQFEEGATPTAYVPFGDIKIKESLIKSLSPKMFVSLMPFTGTYSGTMISHDIAYIYEHLKGSQYVRHTLRYEKLNYVDYVSGDFHGGEVVRYAGAKLFTYDVETKTMNDAGKELILQLESEFVMSPGGWVGGYHGNEFMTSVLFVIDGKIHNVDGFVSGFAEITMKEVNSFGYIMASVMNLDSDKSIFCNRTKNVQFINGGYNIKTKLINFRQVVSTQFYTGISCVAKNLGNKVVSEDAQIFNPDGGDDYLFTNKKISKVYYSHDINNLSAIVESSILREIDNNSATVKIWDRATDSKYYREIYRPTVVGEDIEFEMTVSIY